MTTSASVDPAQVREFTGRVIGDVASSAFMMMVYVGDRLEIFRAMAGTRALTCADLAKSTGLSERHLREWLAAMVSGEYVTYDPAARTYTLPDHHAAVLADEDGMFFLGGVIAYDNTVKRMLLGVPEALLLTHGAVSEPVAQAMVDAACLRLAAAAGVSITGIAGPGGGTPEKPVGLVWIATRVGEETRAYRHQLIGDRAEIRSRAAQAALSRLSLHLASRAHSSVALAPRDTP